MKKDKKKLIVILLIIVVILLLTLITLMTNFGKESSEINIISKDTLKNGDTIFNYTKRFKWKSHI